MRSGCHHVEIGYVVMFKHDRSDQERRDPTGLWCTAIFIPHQQRSDAVGFMSFPQLVSLEDSSRPCDMMREREEGCNLEGSGRKAPCNAIALPPWALLRP